MGNLTLISGSHEFLRAREVARLVKTAVDQGKVLVHMDGSVGSTTSQIESMIIFGNPVVAVITSPEKIDVGFWETIPTDEGMFYGILHHESEIRSNSKFSKFAKTLGKNWSSFKSPSPWELPEFASKFCISEAQSYKKTLSGKLSESLVKAAGTDLGRLQFEVEKASYLSTSLGLSEITIEVLKQSLCVSTEKNLFPLIEAISKKDSKKITSEMSKLAYSSPTMWLCSMLSSQILTWIQVAHLSNLGKDKSEIAAEIGVHPYRLEKELLPTAKRWKQDGLTKLLRETAKAERCVKTGTINSWVSFQTELLKLVSE